MSKYARRDKKTGVARYATADQLCRTAPIENRYSGLSSAKEVLAARHKDLGSWRAIAWELGINDRGTLSRVMNDRRDPSAKLISKMNSVYGCHLHVKAIRAQIPVCPLCDKPYEPKHRCPEAKRTPRRCYDLSDKEARRIAVDILSILHS